MKICSKNVFQYPCPICGNMIESKKGFARKYCDDCMENVRAAQSLIGARENVLGWSGRKRFKDVDPRIVKVVYGVDL